MFRSCQSISKLTLELIRKEFKGLQMAQYLHLFEAVESLRQRSTVAVGTCTSTQNQASGVADMVSVVPRAHPTSATTTVMQTQTQGQASGRHAQASLNSGDVWSLFQGMGPMGGNSHGPSGKPLSGIASFSRNCKGQLYSGSAETFNYFSIRGCSKT